MSKFQSFSAVPLLAQETAPPPGGESPGANPFEALLPFILIFVIFYFVLIRPQRKRQKELQAQIGALKSGDRVITAGGVHGLVTNIKDRTVILKIADNTKIELEKASIQTVLKKKDSAPAGSPSAQSDAEAESSDEPAKGQ